jgi:hypothetical protein
MDGCLQYGRQVSTSHGTINKVTPVVRCAEGEENDSILISNMYTFLSSTYRNHFRRSRIGIKNVSLLKDQ